MCVCSNHQLWRNHWTWMNMVFMVFHGFSVFELGLSTKCCTHACARSISNSLLLEYQPWRSRSLSGTGICHWWSSRWSHWPRGRIHQESGAAGAFDQSIGIILTPDVTHDESSHHVHGFSITISAFISSSHWLTTNIASPSFIWPSQQKCVRTWPWSSTLINMCTTFKSGWSLANIGQCWDQLIYDSHVNSNEDSFSSFFLGGPMVSQGIFTFRRGRWKGICGFSSHWNPTTWG